MFVKRFINNIFNSNSYLLFKPEEKKVWVIDPGSNTYEIISWIDNNNKNLAGIFLTHTHFDHILGLNDLREKYPNANLYASLLAKEGMNSAKLNGSLYKEIPFTITHNNYSILKENDQLELWENITLSVIETPGHDRDCLTFQIGKNLFTGDALIPGIKIFTKLKYSNKIQADASINKIIKKYDDDIIIWPGHEKNCFLKDFK